MNVKVLTYCFIAVAVCVLAETSTAQKQLSLTDAVDVALKNNLQVQSSMISVQSYARLKKSTFELPKTEVTYQYGQFNSINKDNSFEISQTIPFPTYYGARSGLYKAEYRISELKQQAVINEIKAQVQSHYYELQYLQNARIRLRQLDSLYSEFANVAALRYKTGETNLLEKTTAEAKRNEVSLMLQQSETSYEAAYASLKTLMNNREEFQVSSVFEPLSLEGNPDTAAVLNNPSLQMMYQEAVIAQKNKSLETAQTLPDIQVGYFNQSIIGPQNVNGSEVYYSSGDRFTGFNAGITVPLTFFSNSAKVKSYGLQQESLLKAADNNRLLLQTQLQNALQQYMLNLKKYNLYNTSSAQNADAIINTATLGFRSGDIGYLEYAAALQTATDVQLKYLEAIYELNLSVININLLTSK